MPTPSKKNFRKQSLNAKIRKSKLRTETLTSVAECEDRIEKLKKLPQNEDNLLLIEFYEERRKEISAGLHTHGAKKVVYDGIKFDSTLEAYMYRRLKEEGIEFKHQFVIELLPSFRIHGELERAIKIVVDFLVNGDCIIDTKGNFTEKSKMKWKMLKYKLGEDYEFHLPSSQLKCEEVISWIKESNLYS